MEISSASWTRHVDTSEPDESGERRYREDLPEAFAESQQEDSPIPGLRRLTLKTSSEKNSFYDYAAPASPKDRCRRFAMTNAIVEFFQRDTPRILDLSGCDPFDEVLQAKEFHNNEVALPALASAVETLRLPASLPKLPDWTRSLSNLKTLIVDDFQGKYLRVPNQKLRELRVSGSHILEIHVPPGTTVISPTSASQPFGGATVIFDQDEETVGRLNGLYPGQRYETIAMPADQE